MLYGFGIKTTGPLIQLNGLHFREAEHGQDIPEGVLSVVWGDEIRDVNEYNLEGFTSVKNLWWNNGIETHTEYWFHVAVLVPSPIGEVFERNGEWWQEIKPCVLPANISLFYSYDDATMEWGYSNYHNCLLSDRIAIPATTFYSDSIKPKTRPMTWGDAWDLDLWYRNANGFIQKANSVCDKPECELCANGQVSRSHRGPWYPPEMPFMGGEG